MKAEVHHHYYGADPRLDRIESKVDTLIAATEQILMAISAQTQQILDRFDAATTQIGNAIVGVADDLRRLVDKAGLSTEETAAFESRLTELEAQGQSLVALDAEHVPDVP
jgi:cell division GTPase FtsZ